MVLDKAINLKRYAQSCWGLATREWHFIEPVTRGYMVRNCIHCALLIQKCGISQVFYHELYRSREGLDFLERAGIKVTQL